ncbi:hypothetical protein NEDG_00457 [Nematocida displodere]|uniref:Uncharacterized protein n=1 Tax=Nematocida displodere TaxID=1805483 RepID=A0A177ELJ9_9MICR|nr:hypothetical protein NEDG_00457 [Nematocida displodere]
MQVPKTKTSRRWSFQKNVPLFADNLSLLLQIHPAVRFSIWQITRTTIFPEYRGYIELRSPMKMSGLRKILGPDTLLFLDTRKRETIIAEIIQSTSPPHGPFIYGEQELKKGGRPRRYPSRANPCIFLYSEYMLYEQSNNTLPPPQTPKHILGLAPIPQPHTHTRTLLLSL